MVIHRQYVNKSQFAAGEGFGLEHKKFQARLRHESCLGPVINSQPNTTPKAVVGKIGARSIGYVLHLELKYNNNIL